MTESNKEEPKFIVGSAEANVPGSAKFVCSRCTRDVWLARSGQRIVRDAQARPLCMNCMLEQLKNDPQLEIEIPSRETVMEDMGIVNRN